MLMFVLSQSNPAEAKVVELKKIIVACGVRKQWSVARPSLRWKVC
jgi:hypothetical protein